ncbi:type II restriction endonuclease [Gemmatimonas aurantiaca]|uniref:type II restriction endonuclease n=1 Tax=Gemmatimonas aurantiaca TaxID=173480 RepID=UPI00301D7B95
MSDIDTDTLQLADWLASVSGPEWLWYVKYLSANDTYAKKNVHQGGPHLGKSLFATAFPMLSDRAGRESNPDLTLPTHIDSHGESLDLRLVWYNSKRLSRQKNGRDEARLTRWGSTDSPLVEPDATGSLVIFAFRIQSNADADALRIWRCRSPSEEDYLLDRLPDVAPGAGRIVSPNGAYITSAIGGNCALRDEEIPEDWRSAFPNGEALVTWAAHRRLAHGSADRRLVERRRCEEQVFYSVERYHAMPRINSGFESVETFVEFAGSLTNRRKSRSGRSLELHARMIFNEERIPFAWQARTENRKAPDFIFPSEAAYHDPRFPSSSLRMLAAKTTCKDRWRQVLNEADRIADKHLLTLQEGVSVPQFREMQDAGIRLVVPEPIMSNYPDEVRPHLLTVEQLLAELRAVSGS